MIHMQSGCLVLYARRDERRYSEITRLTAQKLDNMSQPLDRENILVIRVKLWEKILQLPRK
jgi:hypothetical protein